MSLHSMRVMLLMACGTLAAAPAWAAPTIRPGLWEFTQTESGDTETDQDCVTAAEAADLQSFAKEMPENCALSSVRSTTTVYAFDIACSSPTQQGKGHFELEAPNPDQYTFRYVFNGAVTVAGNTVPIDFDLRATGKWLDADCGDLADVNESEDD
ncbi:DUF3617 family protein [Sinimarinibacterium sp. CAU 1509]|uniref:DUF3617 domain-containing protein n=1 Tax=Sinimarinibacterium sp. CAU 1509 TaxID=2562283 RepID=UPI0010ACF989|nr:DUF3617 family protein [Sinimarinibacterium sp. CAU 1509]TJY59464.1 DUF3617 family protein [Sinimarinibacterium sp. CAU 1509]